MSKMSSKDKDNKTLHDKLKQFFRINKGSYKSREDFTLTHDIEKEISPDSPVHHRTKAIKELCDTVLNQQWEDRAAERLWSLVKDLLGKDVPREHRHLTLNFLKCLVQGQYSKLSSLMRVNFFMVVKEYDMPEDISLRLELLQTLTENGKDILHLEERMGPFLLEWMPTVTAGDGKRGAEFLSLLVNVIKFNSAYIDEDVISGLVQSISHLCYYSNNTEVVSGCLEALDAIMCYSNLQSDSLQTFIIALCRSVNVETYCQTSWKIMRNLLGTHMGHCALYTMCRLLQDVNFQRDVRLLRGAVFYINMGLWGTHRIPKLECTPASVLPSFYQIINKPFTSDAPVSVDADIKDVKTAVVGIIKIFTSKMYRLPSTHAICAYKILVNHLEQHYKDPSVFHDVSTTRYLIFESFLKIRANALYHIGILDATNGTVTRFSPYLVLEHGTERMSSAGGGNSPPPASPVPLQHLSCHITPMSLTHGCKVIISCIKQEKALTRLPKVFASFIGDQYMSVFAILLPYTNPFKYNHYTVSLAHHVIAVWFLKCRLPFRRDFVKFITTGLKANVIVPFEEGHLMKSDFNVVNEDSSNRKRSSSLTEQGSRGRRERPIMANRIIGESRALDLKPPIDEGLMNFHIELTETCIDLMARYTFSNYSARPKRLPAADFLLKEGQSMTWILGNRLITVTTSGCSNKAMRGGLCDNCWAACKPGFLLLDQTKASHSNLQRTSSIETSKEDKLSRQSSGGHGSSNTNTATNSPTEECKKSVEDTESKKEFHMERTDKDQVEPSKLGQILNSDKQDGHVLCACWCQGWAEIYVRRPTGDMSWIMRIQNSTQFETPMDFPVHDIMALYMPNQDVLSNKQAPEVAPEYSDDEVEDVPNKNNNQVHNEHNVKSAISCSTSSGPIAIPGSPARPSPSRQSSKDSLESLEEGEEDTRRSRNPVRRSNSSPEMSANWKNPFLNKEKLNVQQQVDKDFACSDLDIKLDAELKKHSKNIYMKDMRVSCEAIPEEIFGMGTTPPSSESTGDHPSILRSQRSYPGTTQVSQTISTTASNTVPPSPTILQVAFHVATLMPTKASDPKCTSKKTHIGNNYVTLVYNESDEPYNIQTVKGQFNYACVVIQPLDHGTNQVTVQAREELAEHIGHSEPKIISDPNLAILSRQLALHANLASMVCSSLKQNSHNPYASNWLERLRHIKRLRNRVLQENVNNNPDTTADELSPRTNKRVYMDDFTEYTT
ncbi:hypothetical protein DMN91_006859 [Ooceraea biroi]|uniref:Rap-GAP domain-containing protein n=1 Tax=Ooceraea biroi TaxID=2015173 RepID=A0A3L8DJ68_OOCBI|nr:hypothetical protein DMN91_006859 [Ooceraea biroi]